jgi:hypothetical protein
MASVVQQLAISMGVTVAAYALQLASWFHGSGPLIRADFQVAFVVVGAIAMTSVFVFARLGPDAGNEVSGRAGGA